MKQRVNKRRWTVNNTSEYHGDVAEYTFCWCVLAHLITNHAVRISGRAVVRPLTLSHMKSTSVGSSSPMYSTIFLFTQGLIRVLTRLCNNTLQWLNMTSLATAYHNTSTTTYICQKPLAWLSLLITCRSESVAGQLGVSSVCHKRTQTGMSCSPQSLLSSVNKTTMVAGKSDLLASPSLIDST